jgi:twinkle protein
MELSEIKKALAARAEEVCRFLLPDGKLEKNEWVGGHVATGDGGHSLRVVLSGDKAGIFKDFGGDAKGSNLVELWLQTRGLEFQTALKEVKEWLDARGVKSGPGGENDLRSLRKKAMSKPSKVGITYLANKAEFYLTSERRLTREVVKNYKIGMMESGDAVVFPYLNESTAEAEMIKYVKLDRDERGKKVSWTSKDTPKVLYGKHTRKATDRRLLICEGEIDAMTWAVVLAGAGVNDVCCTSVPFGAKWEGKDGNDPNSEWIENDWEFIHSFESMLLSPDMDEEGQKMQASLVKRLGREVCFIVKLAMKDANEMLVAGRGAELVASIAAAATLDPASLKNTSEYRQNVLDRLYSGDAELKKGIALPFGPHPFHLRWNEVTLVTGQNGGGKTQVINNILVHLWTLGYKSCIASMEVPVGQTLAFLVAQSTGEKIPPRPVGERAIDWLAGGFWFYDCVGIAKWADLLNTFRYAYRRHGIRFFAIDSWMKLGIDPKNFDEQGRFLNALVLFVAECDVHVFLVAHPRKLDNEVETVGKMDVKGSGEITDQVANVITVWRNKAKEAEIEKMLKFRDDEVKIIAKRKLLPDAKLIVTKQRNDDGDEPTIDLWFVKSSKQFYSSYRERGHSSLLGEKVQAPVESPVASSGEIGDSTPF